jgi:hypothetical protein
MQQGMQQGTLHGERLLLKRQLARRFGSVSSAYLEKIENADADALLSWSENILEAKDIDSVFGQYH